MLKPELKSSGFFVFTTAIETPIQPYHWPVFASVLEMKTLATLKNSLSLQLQLVIIKVSV